MLPAARRDDIGEHLKARRQLYERDLQRFAGYVPLPDSVRHRSPTLDREWAWQFCFVSATVQYDAEHRGVRWHATPGHLARTLAIAARAAGIVKRVTPHTLRRSFATHILDLRAGLGRAAGADASWVYVAGDDDDLRARDNPPCRRGHEPAGPAGVRFLRGSAGFGATAGGGRTRETCAGRFRLDPPLLSLSALINRIVGDGIAGTTGWPALDV